MKTQVAIVGGGPSGLLLAELLHKRGIASIVLERKTRDYVLGRIRAGVLERGLVTSLDEAGVGKRLHSEGFVHEGCAIVGDDIAIRIDFKALTGYSVVVYGQTEVTRDLYDAREAAGGTIEFEVEDVTIEGLAHDEPANGNIGGDKAAVRYRVGNNKRHIECDFVAGCDGFHGVSRQHIPLDVRHEYEKTYPFGWLGVLSETPPVDHELIYANSRRGFALCSMRNHHLSRYYIQCSLSDSPDDWSDHAFWQELKRRLPKQTAESLETGPSIEKSIAPLRSFVTEPMRYGRLFLCGDAAHIVPPTGAKGLNTAASDVHYLYHALLKFYEAGSTEGIANYSQNALARVWKAERFSWWFSSLLHRYPDQSAFDLKMQQAELAFLRDNIPQQRAFAQNYVGLPY